MIVEISDGFGVRIRRAISKITKRCLGEEATRFRPRWHFQSVYSGTGNLARPSLKFRESRRIYCRLNLSSLYGEQENCLQEIPIR